MTQLYAVLFEIFGVFCHQMPERSWIFYGVQAPLCIRCSAILMGSLVATAYIFSRHRLPSPRISALLASPLLLDVAAQLVGLYDGGNALRFVTGFGFGLFFLIGSLTWLAGRAELARSQGRMSILPWPGKSA